MPVYEYEPDDRECLICNGRVEVLQAAADEPLKYCPTCGLEVCRVISRTSFKFAGELPKMERAGKAGFTTYKKDGVGQWQRIDGTEGPDRFARPPEDPKPAKVLDLDSIDL